MIEALAPLFAGESPDQRLGSPLQRRAHRPLHLRRLDRDRREGALRPPASTPYQLANVAGDPASPRSRPTWRRSSRARRLQGPLPRPQHVRRPVGRSRPARPPNLILLITDQQRAPRHWPDDPGWLRRADAERRRAGAHRAQLRERLLQHGDVLAPAARPCSPGAIPAEHGVGLTLTAGDLRPDPRNLALRWPRRWPGSCASGEAPRPPCGSRFARGALRLGPSSGDEPVLPPEMPNMATLLRDAGYEVAYKGKWHLTHPVGGSDLLGGWGAGGRRALRARLRLRRLGAARRRRERQGGELRRRQRGRRARAGTRSTPARPSDGSRAPTCPSRSAWSSRWSTPTTSSATRPPIVRGGYARTDFASSVSACRRPSTRTCATSRPSTR